MYFLYISWHATTRNLPLNSKIQVCLTQELWNRVTRAYMAGFSTCICPCGTVLLLKVWAVPTKVPGTNRTDIFVSYFGKKVSALNINFNVSLFAHTGWSRWVGRIQTVPVRVCWNTEITGTVPVITETDTCSASRWAGVTEWWTISCPDDLHFLLDL